MQGSVCLPRDSFKYLRKRFMLFKLLGECRKRVCFLCKLMMWEGLRANWTDEWEPWWQQKWGSRSRVRESLRAREWRRSSRKCLPEDPNSHQPSAAQDSVLAEYSDWLSNQFWCSWSWMHTVSSWEPPAFPFVFFKIKRCILASVTEAEVLALYYRTKQRERFPW